MDSAIQSTQFEGIYQSLNKLNISELDEVMQKILGLRKEKLPSVLSEVESSLLKKINIAIPDSIQKRYDKLLKIKQKENLNEQEYDELLELNSFIEAHNNQRLKHIIALAQYRNQSVDEILLLRNVIAKIIPNVAIVAKSSNRWRVIHR